MDSCKRKICHYLEGPLFKLYNFIRLGLFFSTSFIWCSDGGSWPKISKNCGDRTKTTILPGFDWLTFFSDWDRIGFPGVNQRQKLIIISPVSSVKFNLDLWSKTKCVIKLIVFFYKPSHIPPCLMAIFFPCKQAVRCNSQWFGKVIPLDPQTGFSWPGHDFLQMQLAIPLVTKQSCPEWHRTLRQRSTKNQQLLRTITNERNSQWNVHGCVTSKFIGDTGI